MEIKIQNISTSLIAAKPTLTVGCNSAALGHKCRQLFQKNRHYLSKGKQILIKNGRTTILGQINQIKLRIFTVQTDVLEK